MSEIILLYLNGHVPRNKIINLFEKHMDDKFYFLTHLKNDKNSETIIFKNTKNENFNKQLKKLRSKNIFQYNTFTLEKKKKWSIFGNKIKNNLPDIGIITMKIIEKSFLD